MLVTTLDYLCISKLIVTKAVLFNVDVAKIVASLTDGIVIRRPLGTN